MKNQAELDFILSNLRKVLLQKHKDYGPLNIALAPGGPMNGLRVRMYDKLARLNNLIDTGDTPNYESIEDTLIDLANYAIIGILVQNGQWAGVPDTPRSNDDKQEPTGFNPKRSPDSISRPFSRQDGTKLHKVVSSDPTVVRRG